MEAGTLKLRARRILAAVGAAGIVAAAGAPSAFAQVGLPGLLPSTSATDPVIQTVNQVTETAAQVLPSETPPAPDAKGTEPVVDATSGATTAPLQASAQTVNETVGAAQKAVDDVAGTAAGQSLAPVADTARNTVDEATATVNRTIVPVADTAEKTVDTVLKTAEPVVTHVVNTAAATASSLPVAGQVVAPVVGNLGLVVENTLRGAGTTLQVVVPLVNDAARTASPTTGLLDSTGAPRGTTQPEAAPVAETAAAVPPASPDGLVGTGASSTAVTTARTPQAPPPAPTKLRTPRGAGPGVFSTLPSAPVGDFQVTPHGGVAMPSSHSHAPLPDIPSGPLTALLSASASAGGGALVILLAALAAALSLAAPGLGRRLRPALAPRPQPILHLSLERPG